MEKTAILLVCCSLFLVSCASKLTPDQVAQLSSIKVAIPEYGENAYVKPIGSNDTNGAGAAMGAGGGFIGGMLAQLVVEGVAAGQRSNFGKKYGSAAEKAQSSVPANLLTTLKETSTRAVSAVPQLKGKVRKSSQNVLKTTITSYGYKRNGHVGSQVLMTPFVNGEVSLSLNGEEIVKPFDVSAQTYPDNTGGHEITKYVSDRSLAKKDFAGACEQFAQIVGARLSSKF